jgi:uncharacterized membrane protein YhiD involved in acid resistance
MPIHLEWYDVLLRLALTLAGGAALGIERSEHSRPAGLRTVLLVCLAASVAMILANLLIGTAGKPAGSFVQLDMMRLPLGILTGVGFIGAGAIIRRDEFVVGVTTAATLWFASVVGLCFGAGRLWLGVAAAALGIFILGGLRRAEAYLPQDHRASLRLVVSPRPAAPKRKSAPGWRRPATGRGCCRSAMPITAGAASSVGMSAGPGAPARYACPAFLPRSPSAPAFSSSAGSRW